MVDFGVRSDLLRRVEEVRQRADVEGQTVGWERLTAWAKALSQRDGGRNEDCSASCMLRASKELMVIEGSC